MGVALNVQVYRGGQLAAEHSFDSDTNRTVKIGRLGSAQLKLEDPAVARIHAVIEFSGTEASLIDMGSTSGTEVNGTKVHKVKLNHGDQVSIGGTTLVVGIGAQAMVMPAVAQAPAPAPAPASPSVAAVSSPASAPIAGVRQAQQAASVSAPEGPVQPRFDGGGAGFGGTLPRITKERLARAAVESRPHPSLPPEETLAADTRLLEMRVYWGETLLIMHHYARPKKITIGENKTTDFFISSEGLPVESFPIIRYIDDEYVLTFCDGMDGEVEIDGELLDFQSIRGTALASKDDTLGESYQVKLPLSARVIIHWGGATFALRFVPPIAPIKRSFFEGLDLQYLNTLIISIFLHAATVVTLMVYPLNTDALRVDLFDEPDRFAQLVLEPPKSTQSTRDLLDKLEKQVKEKKDKLQPPPLTPSKVATSTTTQPAKSKAQKAAEVKQKFSELLRGGGGGGGAGGGGLLGGGGGGSLSGSLSNVIGTAGKGSAAGGLAGLGIRGSGPLTGGGVGTSRGVGGIGTSGRLGGGSGGYGARVGGLGERSGRGMISLSTPVVMGALPPDVIKKVIDRHKAQIRYCYEFQLQRNQNLEGRIMMSWIIAATGSVAKVKVAESTMKNAAVESCIAEKIKTWMFPAPAGGGIVEVNYPFVFRAG
ncbi:MAG: AgmX/PglI C-terminal domain-containing protein [Myxococcota bacterium]